MKFQEEIHPDFVIDYKAKLGSGAFGDVFKGMWKSKNRLVAVKKIKDVVPNAKQIMDEEVKVMQNLKHQNVLNFLNVIKSDQGTFLIIQFCQGGGLEKQIQKGIPQIDCFLYLKQMVDGMCSVNKALHIHRDLKPENILFTKNKTLKICDFGLARRVIGDDPNKMQRFSAKGTPLYACPQILRGEKYGAKCDVWSVGVILVQMLTKTNPFEDATNFSTLKRLQQKLCQGKHYVLGGNYHPWFKEIITAMVVFNEENRWNFYQLKQKIDKDYVLIMNQLGSLDRIETTKVSDNNKGDGITTFINVPQNNTNIAQVIMKFPKKDKAPQNVSNVSNNSNNGANSTQMAQRLLTRQQNKKLLVLLKQYVEFIYHRGKLFSDVGTKYFQASQNPKQNGYKFLILFLSIGVFCKSVQKVYDLMTKTTSFTLPNGTIINFNSFDQKSKNDFKGVQKDYQTHLKKQFGKFKETINQIYSKMFSQKYAIQYSNIIVKYPHIMKLLKDTNNQCCKQSLQTFQKCFVQFFTKQCKQPNINSLPQGFIRTYWLVLNLVNINKVIPYSKFDDHYIINNLIDKSIKAKIQEIKRQIEIVFG